MLVALSLVISLGTAAATPSTASKVPPEIAREMAEAVVAVNKALGLESWPLQGAVPCVDRGGEGSLPRTSRRRTRAGAPNRLSRPASRSSARPMRSPSR